MHSGGKASENRVVSFNMTNENSKSVFVNMIKKVDSRDFLMALHYGYMNKKSKTWYKNWTERFYVLSNIGLVYMEKPEDKEIKLFPFIDFIVEAVPKKTHGKDWVM